MNNRFAKFALISFAAAGTIFAAQEATPAPAPPQAEARHSVDPQKQLNHLTKKLALTGDQQSQIMPILTDRQQQVSQITSDTTLTRKDRHAKLVAVRNDAESKIRNILTDTQRSAYDQMQQEERERARTRRQTTTAVQ